MQQLRRRVLLEAACLRVWGRVRGLPAMGAVLEVAAVRGARMGGEVGVGLLLGGFSVLGLRLGLGLVVVVVQQKKNGWICAGCCCYCCCC